MANSKTDQSLAQAFAGLSQAAKRRKVYSHKAARDGRPEFAHFLRAMALVCCVLAAGCAKRGDIAPVTERGVKPPPAASSARASFSGVCPPN